MKNLLKLSILLMALMFSSRAWAGWAGLLNLGYGTDSFTHGTTSSTGLTYTGAVLMLGLDRKGAYFVGYHFGSTSQTAAVDGTTGVFTTTDLGPFLAFYLNRARTVGLTLGYNLQSTAKFTEGTATAQEWQGTSFHAGLGVEHEAWEGIWIGAKLTMYSMSYSRDVTLGATNSTISHTRQWISPVFTISFR